MRTNISLPRTPQSSLKGIIADLLAFAIALTTPFSVNLVGSLPLAEIIILLLAPIFIIFRRSDPIPKALRSIFLLMGLWLSGQILTDLYRHTAAVDWLRGDAAIVFFVIDLAFLRVLLSGNERRKAVFIMGLAIGGLLRAKFAPSEFAQGAPWKFGYSSGTILLVLLISCFFYKHRQYIVVDLLFLGIIAVNLLENYRSPVLVLLIGALLVLPIIPERIGGLTLLPRVGSVARVVVLAGLTLGGAWVASSLVNWVTSAGLIGEEAQAKNEQEAQGTGILLGGRPEILVSSRAVMESPLLGHGSWAKDYRYLEMLNDILVEQGKLGNLEELEEVSGGLIPTHSHLMGAWVSAGILGAVFWVALLWWLAKAIIRVTILRPPLAPLYAEMLVNYLWSILFSPFGSTLRVEESLLIIVALDLLAARAVARAHSKSTVSGTWTRRFQRRPARFIAPAR